MPIRKERRTGLGTMSLVMMSVVGANKTACIEPFDQSSVVTILRVQVVPDGVRVEIAQYYCGLRSDDIPQISMARTTPRTYLSAPTFCAHTARSRNGFGRRRRAVVRPIAGDTLLRDTPLRSFPSVSRTVGQRRFRRANAHPVCACLAGDLRFASPTNPLSCQQLRRASPVTAVRSTRVHRLRGRPQ